MRGNNCWLCYYTVACIAGSVLVVYFCSRSDSIGRVVYALLLEQQERAEERRRALKVFVFRLPKFISRLLNKLKIEE